MCRIWRTSTSTTSLAGTSNGGYGESKEDDVLLEHLPKGINSFENPAWAAFCDT